MATNTPRSTDEGLAWPPLIAGTLLKRYKRFLADVRLADGRVVTAHCPNSGSMKGCSAAGQPVFISRHDTPGRKLKFTWQLIEMHGALVGVNTQVPNRLVGHALRHAKIPGLRRYCQVQPEVKVGAHTRLDFALGNDGERHCYVEVKNCTLVEDGIARFPDAVTARGKKHLIALETLVAGGYRGIIFYLVQRTDANLFQPADHIDPAYGQALRTAMAGGVEIMVYDVDIDLDRIRLNRPLAFEL